MATKTEWRYKIHTLPVGEELSSSNEAAYLTLMGNWGTRLQASREGLTVASSMAAQQSRFMEEQYSRETLYHMAKALADGRTDGVVIQPENTEKKIYVSLEIN